MLQLALALAVPPTHGVGALIPAPTIEGTVDQQRFRTRYGMCRFMSKWKHYPRDAPESLSQVFISVDNTGQISWNRVPVSKAQTVKYLGSAAGTRQTPFIVLEIDNKVACKHYTFVSKEINARFDCVSGGCGFLSAK